MLSRVRVDTHVVRMHCCICQEVKEGGLRSVEMDPALGMVREFEEQAARMGRRSFLGKRLSAWRSLG